MTGGQYHVGEHWHGGCGGRRRGQVLVLHLSGYLGQVTHGRLDRHIVGRLLRAGRRCLGCRCLVGRRRHRVGAHGSALRRLSHNVPLSDMPLCSVVMAAW